MTGVQGDAGRLTVYLRDESVLFDVLTSPSGHGGSVMVSLRVNSASVVSRDFYTLHVRTQFMSHPLGHVTLFT